VSLLASPTNIQDLKKEAVHLPSWDLTFRQIWDLELLLNGAFSPLNGYLGQKDYDGVVANMRLADGKLWPMPITLDVTNDFAGTLKSGARVALRHPEGMVLAILSVSDVWMPNKDAEAESVLGTTDDGHPGVFELKKSHPAYVGGALEGVELPPHHTFRHLRHTPAELKAEFARLGWKRIVAFQTRNPMHRAHAELARRAAQMIEGNLLIHPVVGMTNPGDVDYFTRVRCYEAVIKHMPPHSGMVSLLPLAMRMGGPREAVWHSMIRKNYGATHFIVGRDHAGPSNPKTGKGFYGPYDAQQLAEKHQKEVGIEVVSFEEMVYYEDKGEYWPVSKIPEGGRVLNISGTELRRRLREGADIPDWFTYPEVVKELRMRYPDRSRQGFTLFLTGLSGSGKSTIANVIMAKLMEVQTRPVTMLDGDLVRKHLSSELGFSKEHRDLNIKRIGYVASEITKNHGAAICAPIAPYRAVRREVRQMIDAVGAFIEVYINAPIEVCEQRDRKGLYAKARAGLIKGFTGIDDPYEAPENAEIVLETDKLSVEEAAAKVLLYLENEGFIAPEAEQE